MSKACTQFNLVFEKIKGSYKGIKYYILLILILILLILIILYFTKY